MAECPSPYWRWSDIVHQSDEPPIMPEDPYAYIMAAYQVPPSPDYIPGPEVPPSPDYIPGPEEPQSPPPMDFVPEPMYPEYIPQEDEILPAEEQLLPAIASPTADSPGYVPESDPGMMMMRRRRSLSEMMPRTRMEEEEHPALANSVPPVERLLALTITPPSPLTPLSSPLPHIPSPPFPASPLASPIRPLGYRAAMIRLRAETPSTSHPLPLPTSLPLLQLLSSSYMTDRPEITLPPQKRLGIDLGPRYELRESSAAAATRPIGGRRIDYGFVGTMDTEIRRWRAEEAVSLQLLAADPTRAQYGEFQRQLRPEKRSGTSLNAPGEALKMAPKRKTTRLNPDATPTPVTDTHTTTSVTNAQIQAMINEGVTAALAARDATRNGDDSHTSGTGVRRPVQVARECTYPDFLKCQPLNFKGTEGVVGLTRWFEKMESVFSISNCTTASQVKFATCTLQDDALTWWNAHVKTTTPEAAHAMPWATLKKKMTDKYCPRGEIKKIEAEMWNLKVKGTDVVAYNRRFQQLALMCARMFPEESDQIERYIGGLPDMILGSVKASKSKTMQEVIEFTTELMEDKTKAYVERLADNKRKAEDSARNNQIQQANKRQNTGRAYAAGNVDRGQYEGP
ncbi:reverse transcriptase domain-containing protein, partial [Tanacetum coccineum]